MATLTLVDYQGPLQAEEGTVPWRLLRYYGGGRKQYSVFIVGGVATTYPGRAGYSMDDVDAADAGSGYDGKAAFIGGYVWDEITAGEETILTAAGYTVT